ncbi:glycerate kinase [Campylobacter sp. 19-13652]|uniref:glycerate kinase family protein n=1 Tax=Campylobacter sp. 19-13652 TaxID=2840180 RepID=UPI001C851F33|nr:glycerate kinase [Campylobacter sp. 19-13652]
MKVVVAIDSFKGSLSSLEAGEAVKEGIGDLAEVAVVPIADGGEGTVEALRDALGGKSVSVVVSDPLGRKISASYAMAFDRAIFEMAASSGLPLLEPSERNPMKTSTYGFGELLLDALNKGARKFIIGIGGSATNDAGMGMLRALGVKFKDASGAYLAGVGADLMRVASVDISGLDARIRECEIVVACDVNNPLYGENGAAYIYGAQKGANADMIEQLDAGLRRFCEVASRELGADMEQVAGAGAAGGLGYALLAFLGASLRRGVDIVCDEVGLKSALVGADLVITGEGRFDTQSLMGKTPSGVAKLAKAAGAKVVVLAGSLGDDLADSELIDACFSVVRAPCSLKEAMRADIARINLKQSARQAVKLFIAGAGLEI